MRTRSRTKHVARAAFALCALSAAFAACAVEAERAGFDTRDGGADGAASLPEAAPPAPDAAVEPQPRDPWDPNDDPVTCGDAGAERCAVQLVAGHAHFCARMSDGTVRCWGDDALGQLGSATPPSPDAGPRDAGDAGDAGADAGFRVSHIARISDITQLSAGGNTSCARRQDGTVFCWGANGYGELGTGAADGDPHPSPAPVAVGGPSVRVDVGQAGACALRASGALVCWGRDDWAQLARTELDGGDVRSLAREPGPAATGALGLVATRLAYYTTFGLTAQGELYSWGALGGNEGVVGGRVSSLNPDLAPRRLAELSKVTSFATSIAVEPPIEVPLPGEPIPQPKPPRAHACAIADGELWCWGRSYVGALCTGLPDREVRPKKAYLTSKAWPQQVAVGDEITCVRMTDGTVQCCGSDRRGRLGAGAPAEVSAFLVPVSAVTSRVVAVATSDEAVCALVEDGSVTCWGGNAAGELGQGARDDARHATPVKVRF